MLINRSEIVRGILIGLCVFLCLSILLITLYLLYRYRKESIYFHENLNNKQIIFNNEQLQIKEEEEEEKEIIDPLINIETTPTIIEELMRKSIELAKTAEKVADEKEKKILINENIHINL